MKDIFPKTLIGLSTIAIMMMALSLLGVVYLAKGVWTLTGWCLRRDI